MKEPLIGPSFEKFRWTERIEDMQECSEKLLPLVYTYEYNGADQYQEKMSQERSLQLEFP